MLFSVEDSKTSLYAGIGILGLLCIIISTALFKAAAGPDSLFTYFTAFILMVVGLATSLLGLEVFYWRDDSEIWH